MLSQMSVANFSERLAYAELNGRDDTRYHVAMICAAIKNVMSDYLSTKTDARVKYSSPDDFLPESMKSNAPKKRKIRTQADVESIVKGLGFGRR